MIRLEVRTDSPESDAEVTLVPSEKISGETVDYYLGKSWIFLDLIDWPEKHKKIEIKCSWKQDDLKSVVGLWLPVHDKKSQSNSFEEVTHKYGFNEQNSLVSYEDWKFGQEASVILSRIDETSSPSLINNFLAILCRPRTLSIGDKSTLLIEINSVEEETISNLIRQKLTFEMGEIISESENKRLLRDECNLISNLKAFESEGLGNAIHPKQIATIRALELALKDIEPNEDPSRKISLAYIGPDTTENICSIYRWLKTSGNLNKISKIKILFYPQWDSKFLLWLPKEHPININKDKLDVVEISEGNLESLENSDIVITTFVAPWVLEGETVGEFKKLMSHLIGASTRLISVDPKICENSIRSHISGKFNLNSFHRDTLNLIPFGSSSNDEHPSVEWKIWGLPNEA